MAEQGAPYPTLDLDTFTLSEGKSSQPEHIDVLPSEKRDKNGPRLSTLREKVKRNGFNLRTVLMRQNEDNTARSNHPMSNITIVNEEQDKPLHETARKELYEEYVPYRHVKYEKSSKLKMRRELPTCLEKKSEQVRLPSDAVSPGYTVFNAVDMALDVIDSVLTSQFPMLIPYKIVVKVALIVALLIQFNWILDLCISMIARNVYE